MTKDAGSNMEFLTKPAFTRVALAQYVEAFAKDNPTVNGLKSIPLETVDELDYPSTLEHLQRPTSETVYAVLKKWHPQEVMCLLTESTIIVQMSAFSRLVLNVVMNRKKAVTTQENYTINIDTRLALHPAVIRSVRMTVNPVLDEQGWVCCATNPFGSSTFQYIAGKSVPTVVPVALIICQDISRMLGLKVDVQPAASVSYDVLAVLPDNSQHKYGNITVPVV